MLSCLTRLYGILAKFDSGIVDTGFCQDRRDVQNVWKAAGGRMIPRNILLGFYLSGMRLKYSSGMMQAYQNNEAGLWPDGDSDCLQSPSEPSPQWGIVPQG